MLRKIMLAMVAVLVATPAFAAVQNVKVSGGINSYYVNRDRFDLKGRVSGENIQYDQSVFFTSTTLRVDADLSDNVQTVIQLINERAWGDTDQLMSDGSTTDNNTGVDINLAYVRMKELLYSPLTVEIGRMQLNYGNGFVIGNGTNNSTYATNGMARVAADLANDTAYDTVRAILDYKPLTVDIFAAKVNSNYGGGGNTAGTDGKDDDVDLYGINANYQLGDDMNSVVEAYFFSKFDHSGYGAGSETDRIYTPGLRASTNPIAGLNVQGEVAWQKGTRVVAAGDNDQRDAFGGQAIVNYQVKQEDVEKYKPVLQGVYTYLSGDSNPADVTTTNQASSNVYTAWDPMFEGQSGGKIYNALFNLTNDHIVELSAAFDPIEDLNAKFSWTGLWLDKSIAGAVVGGEAAGIATLGGGTTSFPIMPDGTIETSRVTSNLALGQELDAVFTYSYTEDVQFGLNLGWFFPGEAFDSANNENAKQAIANVNVAF